MIKRFLLSAVLFVLPLWAHADWAADRDASAGYVTVTTLATAVDEAVPFVVVYLSDLPADFHTAMTTASDTDGKTIRVSTSDGTTQLACVPIGVNTGTDTGCLIFLGTGMSASVDVDYRIYVGNAALSMPSASGGMGIYAVFAAYAAGYMPGVRLDDISGHGFGPLTAVNSPGTAASGYEGITAATYNGTSQYHYNASAAAVTGWPLTHELLAYAANVTGTKVLLGLSYSTSASSYSGMYLSGANSICFNKGASGSAADASKASVSATTWHYLAGNRNSNTSGTTNSYIDGGTAATNTGNLASPNAFDRVMIGAQYFSGAVSNYSNARIAVALLSSSVRSADYMSTMQDNWAGTMYSTGAWTALGTCNTGSTGFVLFGAISQTATAAVNWANITDAIVDDFNSADVSLDETTNIESEQLLFSDIQYGTTIPTGADSYTITIRVKVDTEGGGKEINDLLVKFRDDTGTNVGDNLASATQWPSSPGTRDYVVTGYTPDGTEFDADAGLAFSATGFDTAGSTLAEVYVAWIKIDWTCGDDAAAKARGFFALTE